jgi:DNA-binding beta-propeller fold protein YncE
MVDSLPTGDPGPAADAVPHDLAPLETAHYDRDLPGDSPPAGFSLVAELGDGLQPPLKQPLWLAVDVEQRILVLDRPTPAGFRLARFSAKGAPEGPTIEFARGAADDELHAPVRLTVDGEGQLYIPDAVEGCVKKFAPDGRWLETFRPPDSDDVSLTSPCDVAVDASGNLYVADADNNRIIKLLADGSLGCVLDRFGGRGGEPEDEFYEPCSICLGPGPVLYVADRNRNRVLRFGPGWEPLGQVGGDELFAFPSVVRIAGPNVYIADRGNHRVQRFRSDPRKETGLSVEQTGVLTLEAGDADAFHGGGDVAIDADGHVVMIDPVRETIAVLAFVDA